LNYRATSRPPIFATPQAIAALARSFAEMSIYQSEIGLSLEIRCRTSAIFRSAADPRRRLRSASGAGELDLTRRNSTTAIMISFMPAPQRDDSEPRDRHIPMLNYEGPAPQWVRDRRQRMMRLLGAMLSAGSVFVVVFILIISGIESHPIVAGTANGAQWLLVPGICAVGGTILLGGIAYWQWTRKGSTAFAAGVLIGLGVAALVEGLCFAALYGH
jgi:hypothetical protein